MKRRKLSKACKGKPDADEVATAEIQYSGLSLADLPRYILVEILLRTPIKGVIICRCTCKTLQDIISDPEFTRLHFAQQDVCPIIRKLDTSRLSRTLYLLQLGHDQDFMGRFSCQKCRGLFNPRCGCHFNIRLDTKLKLPLRNLQLPNGVPNSEFEANRNQCFRLKPKDHKYKLVNSCNGLLCLSEPSDNNPVAVCNPITGEFINLPKGTNGLESRDFEYSKDCGLGFSRVTCQYKVVRIYEEPWPTEPIPENSDFVYHGRSAEVHTLGTESWRYVGIAPRTKWYKPAFPTYLNGALHWFCLNDYKSDVIVCFDFEKEQFQSFSSPPWTLKRNFSHNRHRNTSMGVLDGCLFICESFGFNQVRVWIMKEYGNRNSWTEAYSIHGGYDILPKGIYVHIEHLPNGALLLFQYSDSAVIYYKGREKGIRYFKIKGVQSSFELFAHTPSIVSLKDIVGSDDLEVLNFWSRFSDVRLPGEAKPISLREDTWNRETDSDSSYDRRRVDRYLLG